MEKQNDYHGYLRGLALLDDPGVNWVVKKGVNGEVRRSRRAEGQGGVG